MMSPFEPRTLPDASGRATEWDSRRDADERRADDAGQGPFADVFANAVAHQDDRPRAEEGTKGNVRNEERHETEHRTTEAVDGRAQKNHEKRTAGRGDASDSEPAAAQNAAKAARAGVGDAPTRMGLFDAANAVGQTQSAAIREGRDAAGHKGSGKQAAARLAASTKNAGAQGPDAAQAAQTLTEQVVGRSAGMLDIAEGMEAMNLRRTAQLGELQGARSTGLEAAADKRLATPDVAPLQNETPSLRFEASAPVRSPQPTRAETPPVWEQALDRAQALALEGGGDARLALRPDGLGHMNLRVRVVNGRVVVTVVAENGEAASLMQRDAERLTQAMAVQGFEETELDVRTGDPHAQQHEHPSAEEREEASGEEASRVPTPKRATGVAPTTKRHDGILDVVA